MRRRLVPTLAALLALAPAGAAHGSPADDRALRSALGREAPRLGGASGVLVAELESGRVLYARREAAGRIPASVEKLYTTATALLGLGGDATLETVVAGRGTLDPAGTWHGDLYLRGLGDPTFGSERYVRALGAGARASTLAERLVLGAGIRALDGRVRGDESFFDRRRGGPRTGYRADGDLGGPLSALSYDRGRTNEGFGPYRSKPATGAAATFATELRRAGVRAADPAAARAGRAPSDATVLATVSSPTIARIVRLVNGPSNNYLAEMLVKGLGARLGEGGTTAAGAAVVRARLARLGARPRVSDGSGLSRANRTTPRQVVRVLRVLLRSDAGPALRTSLPIAGRSGTLKDRMRGTAAQDRCRGKTGTLRDVSAIAGLCRTAGGATLVYAILSNGVGPAAAKRVEDRMVARIGAYRG